MNPNYISPSVKFAKIENFAVAQSGLALQAGCPGELFAAVNSISNGGGFFVAGQVSTEPALPDLNGCTAQFDYQLGGSDTFNIVQDCDITSHDNGDFIILCSTLSSGALGSYTMTVECSSKGYGLDTSGNCNIN